MAKYVYPAIFTEEPGGAFSVAFPDVEGCYTCGDNLAHAMEMAKDALCLMLYDKEEAGEDIPAASGIKDIAPGEGEFTSLVSCDTIEYRKFYHSKAVKKTLTIPAWLNTMAEKEEINFSAVLQRALKAELNI